MWTWSQYKIQWLPLFISLLKFTCMFQSNFLNIMFISLYHSTILQQHTKTGDKTVLINILWNRYIWNINIITFQAIIFPIVTLHFKKFKNGGFQTNDVCSPFSWHSHLNFSSAKHNAINYQKVEEKSIKPHLVYKMKTISMTKHIVSNSKCSMSCWIIFQRTPLDWKSTGSM